jgi:hypothetical protein
MTTKQVDITNLKKEIISMVADKKACIEILNLVDRNTKSDSPWVSQITNEGKGIYR